MNNADKIKTSRQMIPRVSPLGRRSLPRVSPLGRGSLHSEAEFITPSSFVVTSNVLEIPETFINQGFFNQSQACLLFLPLLLGTARQSRTPLRRFSFKTTWKNQPRKQLCVLTEEQMWFPRLQGSISNRWFSCFLEIAIKLR